jgi:uncharacterized membrane protein
LRYVTIRRYQVSAILLIATGLVIPLVVVAATYFWASKTIPLSVEEPLTVTNYPATLNTHPGENKTLDITITNSANIDYGVILVLTLNDTVYQQSYVEFSNNTYNIVPGSIQIQAWLKVGKKAPPANLQLTVEFHRE